MKARAILFTFLATGLAVSCSSKPEETTIIITAPADLMVNESEEVIPVSEYTPPPESPGTGSLQGQVFYKCNGEPAEKFYIYVFKGSEGDRLALGRLFVDDNGQYETHGLAAGDYRLTASDEANLVATSNVHARVTVGDKETVIAKDIFVDFCPDIKLLQPAESETVNTTRPTFIWEPFAGEVTYKVKVFSIDDYEQFYFPDAFETTTETSLTASEDLPPGNLRWRVDVYEMGELIIPEENFYDLILLGISPERSFIIETP